MGAVLVLPGFEAFVGDPPESAARLRWSVEHGDCLTVLRAYRSATFDSLVADPPAGIGFMGREWDKDKGGRDAWIAWLRDVMVEALRVLKPGAHGIVWALPRTSHWTATALEDAGFEVRDVLNHLFGTGFPKSLGLGDGRGTALKPGAEHWILVRKPCDGTTAANVDRWGTGGLEIDACRIGDPGRWPANVVLSHGGDCSDTCAEDCAVRALDEQAGERKSGARAAGRYQQRDGTGVYGACEAREEREIVASTGSASRFFYCAKPSPTERDLGCDALPMRTPAELTGSPEGAARPASPRTGAGRSSGRRNHHPTVKSIALMRWLCRLVTPPGGVVLDPFCGSGSTGCATLLEGLQFTGIEQDAEYVAIARARIAAAEKRAADQPTERRTQKSETPTGGAAGVSGTEVR
jgi:hypothetical protein